MYRSLKILLILLVVAGTAFAGAKLYMHYQVKQAMDELAFNARPYGELEYAAIETDVRGRAKILDLTFKPNGARAAITIDEAALSGPDIMFFVSSGGWNTEEDGAPPRLRADLLGIRLPTAVLLSQASDDTVGKSTCGMNALEDPKLIHAMGLNELVVDAAMGWNLDERDRSLSLEAEFEVRGVESGQLSLVLSDVDPEAMKGKAETMPSLEGFDLMLDIEPDFSERVLKVCAAQEGKSVEEVREALIKEARERLRKVGIVPGSGLSFAVDSLYRNWGQVRLRATPAKPLGLMSLVFLPPNRLAENLGLGLTVNGTRISDLSFKWEPPQGAGSSIQALFGLDAYLSEDAAEALKKPKKPRVHYRTEMRRISLSDLSRYLDYDVRLDLRGQPVREGRLVAVSGDQVSVQQRLHGGKFTAHVPLTDIAAAQVKLRIKVKPPSAPQ